MLFIFISLLIVHGFSAQEQKSSIITSDIDNFWMAYDKVISTNDSTLQLAYIQKLFLEQGTDGLKALQRLRNYSPKEYVYAINKYPKFWTSIRENTLKVADCRLELEKGIEKLESIYPDLKPAKIYFTIGALRTNGTTLDSSVLIGSELAFANKETPTDEFPESLSHLQNYFNSDPSKHIIFLNIHEYIHTQQKTTVGNSLLAQTVIEGVAEFIAEKVLETNSPNPQIEYGRANDVKIKTKFEKEMFSPYLYNWIWNSSDNEFGMRDLAYYVGYKICENYYNISTNKKQAIKEMIALDYNNENELIEFIEKSTYFKKELQTIKEEFEKSRPKVDFVEIISNQNADAKTDVLMIHFSQKMDTRFRNFQFGPLGEENVIRIKGFQSFSVDGKSVRLEIEKFDASKKYQLIVSADFRNEDGVPLVPYLIEFDATEK